ncbi:MAG: hypothetical protein IPK80_28350 [Nannocystis sp.]|nr:hypothetical protein [Nannocystis sp.]
MDLRVGVQGSVCGPPRLERDGGDELRAGAARRSRRARRRGADHLHRPGIEYYCEGRRPLDHVEAADEGCADPLGRYFAAVAYLEASSVAAFEELAGWLTERGAPLELVRRCEAAAADERLHTRWMTRLAEQHGGRRRA